MCHIARYCAARGMQYDMFTPVKMQIFMNKDELTHLMRSNSPPQTLTTLTEIDSLDH